MFTVLRLGLLVAATSLACCGWCVSGVTFHASFDQWLLPDSAVGSRLPLKVVGGKLVPGKYGQALALDGKSYLEFRPHGNVGTQGGTVAMWFRPDDWGAKTYDNFFGLSADDENCVHFERSHPTGQLRLTIGGPGTKANRSIFSQTALENGQWYHCAATWDLATGRAALYLNGELQAELTDPGPLPSDVPVLLVGCGFARLARAAVGRLDDLVILDHAATPDELHSIMAGTQAEREKAVLDAGRLHVVIEPATGAVTLGATLATGPLLLGPLQPSLWVDGQELALPSFAVVQTASACEGLGPGQSLALTSRDAASGLQVTYRLEAHPERSLLLAWLEVTNGSSQPLRLTQLAPLHTTAPQPLLLPGPPARQRVFLDNGGLCGSGSRDLCTANASHEAHGAMVLTDPEAHWGLSASFVSFLTATVTNRVITDADGQPSELLAACAYPNGYLLRPGETLRSEVFEVALHPSGHAALEQWADTVMAVNDLRPPSHCPSGWNSWYAYRLEISEELVLANARIIRERFAPLGCTNVQIDHGWQYRDVVGHWVPNDRFPQGLPWLSDQLRAMGLSLGLWTSVTNVSEFAPEATEKPGILARGPDGGPHVSGDYWYWEPHGKTYSVDPTSPEGAAFLRDAGQKARSYGCVYLKNDFQGNLLESNLELSDGDLTLGTPVWRRFAEEFRAGMGPQMAYMACNAPLNQVAGLCDAAWTHRDVGNPGAGLDHLRGWANDFACRYHVSGKFYWSDPDYLQVGQGDLDETRIRMAWVALGGGPAFLSDRLPELPEERLALIPKCLPSYRRCARPLDLFTRDGYPRVWDLPVDTTWGTWHVLGLFNLEEEALSLAVDLAQLGLPAGQSVVFWDFFDERLLGEASLSDDVGLSLNLPVPAASCRVLRVAPKLDRPFVLSTDMHLTQGGVELPEVAWDAAKLTLSGTARRMPGMTGSIFVYVPEGYAPQSGQSRERVLAVPLSFGATGARWSVSFRRSRQH